MSIATILRSQAVAIKWADLACSLFSGQCPVCYRAALQWSGGRRDSGVPSHRNRHYTSDSARANAVSPSLAPFFLSLSVLRFRHRAKFVTRNLGLGS